MRSSKEVWKMVVDTEVRAFVKTLQLPAFGDEDGAKRVATFCHLLVKQGWTLGWGACSAYSHQLAEALYSAGYIKELPRVSARMHKCSPVLLGPGEQRGDGGDKTPPIRVEFNPYENDRPYVVVFNGLACTEYAKPVRDLCEVLGVAEPTWVEWAGSIIVLEAEVRLLRSQVKLAEALLKSAHAERDEKAALLERYSDALGSLRNVVSRAVSGLMDTKKFIKSGQLKAIRLGLQAALKAAGDWVG
jgi:hypothetical protein